MFPWPPPDNACGCIKALTEDGDWVNATLYFYTETGPQWGFGERVEGEWKRIHPNFVGWCWTGPPIPDLTKNFPTREEQGSASLVWPYSAAPESLRVEDSEQARWCALHPETGLWCTWTDTEDFSVDFETDRRSLEDDREVEIGFGRARVMGRRFAPKPPIWVWDWSAAPGELKALSRNGGDEDRVALIPKEFVDIPEWCLGEAFGCCSVEIHELDNFKVVIGCHA